ncbi:hypothetical protein BFG52_05795 [Acinetobacter larvae]|uniref:G domain-containing protein n=2 Tax=Acinetobacter larvae TaxID=1789224 RepID=A0A1B2M422_9GAMM|nr:hypothetical protein BFG52_05795 [Acinetobacter larvae]
MDIQVLDQAVQKIQDVLPERVIDLTRLKVLCSAVPATITVIGKYNHGKSRLLNELIGHDIFAVADRRETVNLAEHIQQQARWLDAPGLDADVVGQDDRYAQDALWCQADIRLFVHSLKEGELDAAEQPLLQQLQQDDAQSQRQTLLVLTQIDQVADSAVYEQICQSIGAQAPSLKQFPVSATRHRQGLQSAKALLQQKSGIAALQQALHVALAAVPQARQHEKAMLCRVLQQSLTAQQHVLVLQQQQLQQLQQQQRCDFDRDLAGVLHKVTEDLQETIRARSDDDALIADSFENMFKMTAGKQERARIQVAYSKACLEINSVLIQHGVVSLPVQQRSHVRSIDTIMIAVLGVSVKFRQDLQRIFCETAGRERLSRDFAHYFELSDARQALASQLKNLQSQIDQQQHALDALQCLEAIA